MRRLLCIALIGALGCGRDGGDGGDGAATYAQFCEAFAEAAAGRLLECDGTPSAVAADLRLYLAGECGSREAAVAAGRLDYDASRGRDCLAQLRDSPCDRYDAWTTCWSVPAALVDAGGACSSDAECSTGWCTGWGNACGACRGPGGFGDSCLPDCDQGICRIRGDVCAEGLVCGVEGTCVLATPPGAVDAPCGAGHACEPGLYCDDSSTCRRTKAIGEACGDHPWECGWEATCEAGVCTEWPHDPCSTLLCDAGFHCRSGACVPRPSVGEECTIEVVWSPGPCLGSWCGRSGRCEPYASPGSACGDDARCAPGLECVNGTCGRAADACSQ
jgi:hypothetical protein